MATRRGRRPIPGRVLRCRCSAKPHGREDVCSMGGHLEHLGPVHPGLRCSALPRLRPLQWFSATPARLCDRCAPTAATTSLPTPASSDRNAAEGSRQCISGPHHRLHRLRRRPVDLRVIAGRIRQRAIPARRNDQLLRKGVVVVSHDGDHRRLRRRLPGYQHRPSYRRAADDRRDQSCRRRHSSPRVVDHRARSRRRDR